MKYYRAFILGKLSLLALALSVASSAAFAESEQNYIEEITVTAEKTESSLQSTAISITAIGEDTIRERGLDSFYDVQYLAPNVTYNQAGPTGFITMRGVGLEFTTIMAEPGVSLHSDGVYKGGSMSSSSALFDLERIEVVRGPQGTLNGRNSTGGSVNLYSRMPGDEASFEFGFLAGDYGRTRIEASGDLPISENFKVRVALAKDEFDGYITNTFRNVDEDSSDITLVKATAVWTPTDNLEVILRTDYMDNDATGPVYLFQNVVEGPCCSTFAGFVTPSGDPFVSSGEEPNVQRSDAKGWGLTVNYDISDSISLRSVTSYSEQSLDGGRDIDGTSVPLLRNTRAEDMDEFSQELTLLGTTDRLEWIFGYYYYDSESNHLGRFEFPAVADLFKILYGGIPSFDVLGFVRLDGSSPDFPWLDDRIYEETESSAFYGQATYSVTDNLRATVGLRTTKDEKDFTQWSADNLFTGDICTAQQSSQDWRETTGKVGFDADLSNDWLLYGTVSTGYRSGGFDYGSCFDPFDPEKLISYEIGLKMDISNTLRVNIGAFVYDYEDFQARVFTPLGTETFNAEGADVQGLEVEVDWIASENLRISSSLSYLNSELKDLTAQDPMAPENGFVDMTGNSLLRAPDLQASLAASYDISLTAGLLTLQGDISFVDDQEHSLWNNPVGFEPSRTMSNLRMFFEPANIENFSINAFVLNVSDKAYAPMVINSGLTGGTTKAFGAPRTWGVEIRFKN